MPTCDEITEAVATYNSENSGNDLALTSALEPVRSMPLSVGRFLAEVCLIADWGTIQLIRFPFHDRIDMARQIEASLGVLQSTPNLVRDADDWEAGTKKLTDAVDHLSSQTHLLPTPGANRRQLSFLSKYLHFCISDAFPIWDGNARRALNNHMHEACWQSYRNWVIRVRQEASTHRACCLEQVQSPGECLLRTLDKALYILGREI
jgi:hypothetical protein